MRDEVGYGCGVKHGARCEKHHALVLCFPPYFAFQLDRDAINLLLSYKHLPGRLISAGSPKLFDVNLILE